MGVSSQISGVFLDNVKGKQKKDKNQSGMLGLFTLVWKKSIGVTSSLLCLVLCLLRIWKWLALVSLKLAFLWVVSWTRSSSNVPTDCMERSSILAFLELGILRKSAVGCIYYCLIFAGCRYEQDEYGYRWWGVKVNKTETIVVPSGTLKRFCQASGWGDYDGSNASRMSMGTVVTSSLYGLRYLPCHSSWWLHQRL